MIDINVILPKG